MGRGCMLRRDVVGERSGDWFGALLEPTSVADGDVAGDDVADMTVAIAQPSDKGPKSPLRSKYFFQCGFEEPQATRLCFARGPVVGTQRWVCCLGGEGEGGNAEVQTYSAGRRWGKIRTRMRVSVGDSDHAQDGAPGEVTSRLCQEGGGGGAERQGGVDLFSSRK
jgi:hypothetical protein